MNNSLFSEIKSAFNEIPKPILKFALKGLLIFLIWKSIYILLLVPNRIIDKPLTELVGDITTKGLQTIYPNENFNTISKNSKVVIGDILFETDKVNVMMGNQKLIGIADGCNGLNLYVLFLGFIAAFPSTVKKKLYFGLYGILLVFAPAPVPVPRY